MLLMTPPLAFSILCGGRLCDGSTKSTEIKKERKKEERKRRSLMILFEDKMGAQPMLIGGDLY